MGRLRQSTEKIQELLDMVENNEVGGKVTVDSALSTTSENPVMNKVITEELGKKVNKEDVATINGKSLTEGGNIVIEGGGVVEITTPDWNASEREAGFIQNKIGGDLHLSPLNGQSYWINDDGDRVYQTYYEIYYTKCSDYGHGSGYRWYKLDYTTKWEWIKDSCSGTKRFDNNEGFKYRFPTSQEIENDYRYEGSIILRNDFGGEWSIIENIVYGEYNEYGVENPIPEWFISDEIARQDSVNELREETTALWENLDHGTFPNLTAGDLAGRGESVPASFGFRASGGKSIKDGRAYIKRIKGNSVVWNQKVEKTYVDGDMVLQNIGGIPQGHKFALIRSKAIGGYYYMPIVDIYDYLLSDGEYAKIFVQNYALDAYNRIYCTAESGYVQLIDLTQMFQAGNEPTTIEDFNARVATLGVEDMYAYNEGQVIHCNTESIKSVGDNAWDEQWENGTINVNTGDNIDAEYAQQQIRSKNLIRVLPNEDYYIALPQYLGSDGMWVFFYDEQGRIIEGYNGGSGEVAGNASLIRANDGFMHTASNASYIKFYMVSGYGSTYNHDILISLYHSGWKAQKDDQYQPYWQDTLPLPIISKYFPQGMKKAGAAHDEIRFNKASGKWEYSKGRIKSVDMGSLAFTYTAAFDGFYTSDTRQLWGSFPNFLCSRYPYKADYRNVGDKECGYIYERELFIKDSAYTDAASFKAAMAGVILYYEAADWEWVELDAEDQNFRDYYQVADFGTEMSQSSVPSAPFSADIIYQFNAVDMIREHEAEINELQSIIATMQAQLTSLTHNT